MITLKDAKRISKLLNVDESVISPDRLLVGIKIEMEHGKMLAETNVTNDDLVKTAKIALAHFHENPGDQFYGDYYHHLDKMERESDQYWKIISKPSIFKN